VIQTNVEAVLATSESTPAEYALLAAERSLQLDLRLASGPVVYADPASLDRAVSNLLSNAVRLAPEGTTITVAAGRAGPGWRSATRVPGSPTRIGTGSSSASTGAPTSSCRVPVSG
jgi:signal transduction histidine kinase